MKRLEKNLNSLAEQVTVLTEGEERGTVAGGISATEIAYFNHYRDGSGSTMILGSAAIYNIGLEANRCGNVTSSEWVIINGNYYEKRVVDLYKSNEYCYALGACEMFYDQCGNLVGLKDDYNFHKGDRKDLYEFMTFVGSLFSGKSYQIRYGIYN